MPKIIVKKGDIQVDQYIVEGGTIRIGRTPDNQIVLNDPSVSRSHAEVKIDLIDLVVEAPGLTTDFDLDPLIRHRMLAGLDDIDMTLEHSSLVDGFESARPSHKPVVA